MKKSAKKRGGKREGAGRPRKYNGDSVVVSVKMPKRLATAIESEASSSGQSRNELIVSTLLKRFG